MSVETTKAWADRRRAVAKSLDDAGQLREPAQPKRRMLRCIHDLSIFQECADCNDAARILCGG